MCDLPVSLGGPIHEGQTCMVDHTVRRFTVVVRSMNSISADTIKNLIQTKFEVVECEEVNATTYVHPV